MADRIGFSVFDGDYIRTVQFTRIEEGTVAVDRYQVSMDVTIPLSEAAREFERERRRDG